MRFRIPAFVVGLTLLNWISSWSADRYRTRSADLEKPPAANVDITVAPTRAEFFLGEPVLLAYRIGNVGNAPFTISQGGDSHGPRPVRFTVKITDANGIEVADPFFGGWTMGGLGNRPEIDPGKSYELAVPLHRFGRFEHAGNYTVHVSHDLGWGPIEADDFREVQTIVSLKEPTADDARRILANDAEARKAAGQSHEYAGELDYPSLSRPVYLPALQACLPEGSPLIIDGIAGIATVDATSVLVDLLNDPRPAIANKALAAMLERVPDPEYATLPQRQRDQQLLRQWWVEHTWRAEFAAPVKAYAMDCLSHQNDIRDLSNASAMLRWLAEPSDLPALTDALNDCAGKTPEFTMVPFVGDAHRAQAMKQTVRYPLWVIARKADLDIFPTAPTTTGEFIVYLTVFKHRPEFRPANWEGVLAKALESDNSLVRVFALEVVPQSASAGVTEALPGLLHHADAETKAAACSVAGASGDAAWIAPLSELLRDSADSRVLESASDALIALHAREPVAVFWVGKLAEPRSSSDAIRYLAKSVTNLELSSITSSRPETLPALQQRWRGFLEKHRNEIAAGRTFEPGGPDLPADLFPAGCQFGLPDGRSWP